MPTTYKCNGEINGVKCGRTFTHPAKHIETSLSVLFAYPNESTDASMSANTNTKTVSTEIYMCPFCSSKDFAVQEEPVVTEDVEAVYVADLVSGDNKIIATLCAEGWQIKGRYVKQYILEKPKAKEERDFVADAAAYAKKLREKAGKIAETGLETLQDVEK